jgi:hypothetical protein
MAGKPVVTGIRKLVGFPERHWQALCAPMMETAPEHALELARRVLTLRQGVYLPPGASAEDIYRLRDVWTYAVLVTALRGAGMEVACVPHMGMAWIEADAECFRSMKLALAEPPTGVIAELIVRACGREMCTPAARQEHESARPGEMFIEWLREGIKSGEIAVNVPGARVHVVEDGVLIVSPGAFKEFDAVHWQAVLDDLLAMEIHVARDGSPMRCWNVRDRDGAFVRGVLIANVSLLFDSPPDVNTALEEAI